MKIAIPTENGLTISPVNLRVKSFLVLTVQFGEILDEVIVQNLRNEPCTDLFSPGKILADCDMILVHEIESARMSEFRGLNKEVIETKETIITKAIIDFLKGVHRKETDTCCQP
jgi:predicted Fe-Mo cluster-binding NifX family protein